MTVVILWMCYGCQRVYAGPDDNPPKCGACDNAATLRMWKPIKGSEDALTTEGFYID